VSEIPAADVVSQDAEEDTDEEVCAEFLRWNYWKITLFCCAAPSKYVLAVGRQQ